MKVINSYISTKDETVHEIKIGNDELRLIRSLMFKFVKTTPDLIEFTSMRHRAKSIMRVIDKLQIPGRPL